MTNERCVIGYCGDERIFRLEKITHLDRAKKKKEYRSRIVGVDYGDVRSRLVNDLVLLHVLDMIHKSENQPSTFFFFFDIHLIPVTKDVDIATQNQLHHALWRARQFGLHLQDGERTVAAERLLVKLDALRTWLCCNLSESQ